MLRVIKSTIQAVDIDDELEEDFVEAIEAATKTDTLRETYSVNEYGQKDTGISLVAYTEPTGAYRWAILDNSPAEVDWQDTDDLDEAIATYEKWVRDHTEGAMPEVDEDGNEMPIWTQTDIEGISAEETVDGKDANDSARLIDAVRAHTVFAATEEEYQQDTRRRQKAFARLVDSWGRGGQAVLAAHVKLAEPTVKRIADSGRKLLAAKDEGTEQA